MALEGVAGGVYNARTAQAGVDEAYARIQQIEAYKGLQEQQTASLQQEMQQKQLVQAREAAKAKALQELDLEGDSVEVYSRAGRLLLGLGYPDAAGKIFDQATRVEERVDKKRLRQEQIESAQALQVTRAFDALGQGYAGVTSQDQLEQVNQAFTKQTGMSAPVKTFSPEAMRAYFEQLSMLKGGITQTMRESEAERKLRADAVDATAKATNAALDAARVALAQATEARRVKAEADKPPPGTKVHERDLAEAALNGVLKGQNLKLPNDQKDFAIEEIARHAQELIKRNKGLSSQRAYQLGVEALVKSGRLDVSERSYPMKLFSKEIELKPPKAETPAPKSGAPVTIKSQAEFDALPSGAEFIGPDGKPRRKP